MADRSREAAISRARQSTYQILLTGILLALSLTQSSFSSAAEGESYLCTAEKIAGFSWVGNDWVVTDFNVRQEQYVLQPAAPPEWISDIFPYEITHSATAIGQPQPEFWCGQAAHAGEKSPIIACGGAGHSFRMHVETLRFMLNYGLGYLDGRDSNDTTPYLAIGTCAPTLD